VYILSYLTMDCDIQLLSSDSDMAVSDVVDNVPQTPMASTPINAQNWKENRYVIHTSCCDTPRTDPVASPASDKSDLLDKMIEVRKSGRCPRKKSLDFEIQSSKPRKQMKSGFKTTEASSVSLMSPSSSCIDTSDMDSPGLADISLLSKSGDSRKVFIVHFMN